MHRLLLSVLGVGLCLLAVPLSAQDASPAGDPEATSDASDKGTPASNAGDDADQGPPFLGVIANAAPANEDGTRPGLKVEKVFPRTTAVDLGLKPGDLLTSFNGKKVTSREELKAVLDTVAVGDKVIAAYTRGEAASQGAAAMKARPTRDRVKEEIDENSEALLDLQAKRAAQLEELAEARREEMTLAQSMASLSTTLSALPAQLDQVAKEFKAVYPEGEFTVDVTIRIRTHAQDANSPALEVDLSPPPTLVPDKNTPVPQVTESLPPKVPPAEPEEDDPIGDGPAPPPTMP